MKRPIKFKLNTEQAQQLGSLLVQWLVISVPVVLVVFYSYFPGLAVFESPSWSRMFSEFARDAILCSLGVGLGLGALSIFGTSRAPLAISNGSKDEVYSLDELLALREGASPTKLRTLERLSVFLEIDKRTKRLRDRTTVILATIAFALFGAALVVIFAGRLTSVDVSAVSNLDKLKNEISESKRTLSRLYQFQSLHMQLDAARRTSGTEAERIEKLILNLRDASINPADAKAAGEMLALETEQAKKMSALLDEAWKKELSSEHGYSDWRYIVATAITRVGVVLIIVFLVQILLGLYRYNMRLIAHYNATRDLLAVWDGSKEMLVALNDTLGPSKIDFGKEPKHPLEDIVKAVSSKMDAIAADKSKQVKPARKEASKTT